VTPIVGSAASPGSKSRQSTEAAGKSSATFCGQLVGRYCSVAQEPIGKPALGVPGRVVHERDRCRVAGGGGVEDAGVHRPLDGSFTGSGPVSAVVAALDVVDDDRGARSGEAVDRAGEVGRPGGEQELRPWRDPVHQLGHRAALVVVVPGRVVHERDRCRVAARVPGPGQQAGRDVGRDGLVTGVPEGPGDDPHADAGAVDAERRRRVTRVQELDGGCRERATGGGGCSGRCCSRTDDAAREGDHDHPGHPVPQHTHRHSSSRWTPPRRPP
jgi:hypothetical protein